MREETMLASENAKPTPEEVAFRVLDLWYIFDRLKKANFTMWVVFCGLCEVNVYKTAKGHLFEIWPSNGTIPEGTDVYHLREREDEIGLPEDFKEWFCRTIDRMYGWQK